MRADIVVFFIHFALDVQVKNAFHSGGFHSGRHPGQQRVGLNMREILVHQTIGGNDGIVGHDSTFGEGGAVADPNVLAEDDGFGQRRNLPVAVEVLYIVEGRVHELAVPSGPHVAADDNPLEAEYLEVGADIDVVCAELQGGIVGNHHV